MKEVQLVYQNQQHAFRMNIMFGIILRHVETGEYRYFIPDQNETLFDQPILINSPRDVTLKLRRKLNGTDLMEYIKRQRPDSKWRAEYVTNFKLAIFKSNYLLGDGCICARRCVKAFVKNKNKTFNDNLCAFRCISWFRGQHHETGHLPMYAMWSNYLREKNICDITQIAPYNYPGVNFDDMALFEACFETNVTMYSLQEDGTAELIFRSAGRYKETMYLNVYENHL